MNDSHDLGNHLAAIVGYAEFLETTPLTEEQQQFVNEILVSARSACLHLDAMAWHPDTDEILRLLSQWRGNAPPLAARIDANTSCSACGELMATSDRAVLLIDGNQPIPPDLLSYSLTPGFVTDAVADPDGSRVGIDRVVRALHRAGGHLNLSTTDTETRLLVCLPALERSRL